MRKVAASCGFIEAFGLVMFAISLLFDDHASAGTRGSSPHPFILSFIYLVFSIGIALVSFGIAQSASWARTPFVLIQVFAILVFAYLPGSGSGVWPKVAGYSVGVIAFVGLIAHWRSPANK